MALRRFRFVLWLAVGLAGAACERNAPQSSSGGPGTSAATSGSASASVAGGVDAASPHDVEAAQQAADDESVRYELESQHRHHHRGFAGLVFMAVETLGIAPDQQVAVDKIRKELYANMRPLREANGSLLRVLGDGVATGTIDKTKVDAAVDKASAASATVPAATADTLNALHAALRPEQRAALVDKVDAHWTVWKDTNAGDETTDETKPHSRLAHLTMEIELTSAQVDKVRANLDGKKDTKKPFDATAADAYIKAFDAAFVADNFDAKKLPASATDNTHVVAWGAERMARFYEALVPVLTPAQRTKVADELHQRAADSTPKEKS
jgi:Spy/CpxP family protein refolding chaperone